MRLKRTTSLTVLVISCLMILSACSTKSATTDTSGTPQAASTAPKASAAGTATDTAKTVPAKPVTLGIMWWGPDDRTAATIKATELYTSKFPNVSFTSDHLAWDQYWIKLPVLAASKTVPDVLQMDGAVIEDYSKKGVLMDLSNFDLNGIVDPKVVDRLKINGKLYGIPLSQNGAGIAYNKAELTAAGVTLPHKDWTWDEYIAYMDEAHAKLPKGKYAFTDASAVWDWYQFYQTSYGKGPMMVDGTKFNLDKDLWFKFQNLQQQWRDNGTIPPADKSAAFKENDPKFDSMVSGVMARGVTVGSVGVMETINPGKISVTNNPTGPSGGGWAQPTIFLSVSANSKNPDAAKQFVRWFITDKEAGTTLGLTRGVPINNAIFKELEPSLTKKDLLAKDLLVAAVDKALPFYPAPPGWADFINIYSTEMTNVSFKRETLEQAYNKIVAQGKLIEAKLGKK